VDRQDAFDLLDVIYRREFDCRDRKHGFVREGGSSRFLKSAKITRFVVA